jgi:hypothetical protein
MAISSLDSFRWFDADGSRVAYGYRAPATLRDRAMAERLTQETLAAVTVAAAREGRAERSIGSFWCSGTE